MSIFIKKSTGSYRYPLSEDIFILERVKVVNGKPMCYFFKCGHWCTDCVFDDLIDMSTGRQNFEGKQLQLFN